MAPPAKNQLDFRLNIQADPHALSLLYFKSSNGPLIPLIPLDTLAQLHQDTGPQTINHYGQLNAVTISFDLKPGASLGGIVSKVEDRASQTLPAGITTDFEGTAKAFESSLGNLWVLLIVAIMVVYIVLGILYEATSTRSPFSPDCRRRASAL